MEVSQKSYTITLDDDAVLHRIISKITGINSLPYSDPENLLKRAKSYAPIALFVDINLGPNISGLDYIPQFRELWPTIPIIVVTDNPNGSFIGQALALGANDFIRKPLDADELNGRLHARIQEMNALAETEEILVGNVRYHKNLRSLTTSVKTTYIGRLEGILFQLLSENYGIPIEKSQINAVLWGSLATADNALNKKISLLRASLKQIGANFTIVSKYGGGVWLEDIDQARSGK